jgi:2-hydroxychromene-2-carboxylate isomerase
MKVVDFYFDFLSPYAYLAAHRLTDLVERYGNDATFVSHPIDLVAARFKAGNNGPFNRDQPAKMKCLGQDLKRWAARYGIEIGYPQGFDTARLNRGYFYADRKGKAAQFMKSAFDAVWARSGNPADEGLIRRVASEAGLSPDELLASLDAPEALAAYQKENDAAQARGVFGVPLFMVDDQIYWGNDRVQFLEEYLQSQRSG